MAIQQHLIKADRRTLNSYDMMYNAVSKKPLFNQEDWINSANNGTLDTYVQALFNSDTIDVDQYRKKYNLDYADSKTRLTALYNETGANRMNADTKRKKTVERPDGTIEEQEYLASDYEYNLSLIRQQNDYYQQVRQREIAQDMKDSMSAGDHIASFFTGTTTSLISGVASGLDNLTALVGSVGETIVSRKGETLDQFTELLASDKYRPFSGLRQNLLDFETNYTSMRDVDGNYTTYGRYVGGVMTSLGEMLPSMMIGMGAGKIAGVAGATAKGANKVGSIVSQASFYSGMGAGNVQDMYKQFEESGADIDSAAILSNAAIKSALQFAVEKALGKVLGTTSLDNMVFGRPMKAGTGKSLTGEGVKTIFKDVLQEGLEEVFQDTSDFLVDKAYEAFIKEFKGTSEISWQSLIDAFVIGGISSFAGSARNIIATKNVYAGNKKLNKIASWQYGLNMQSFAESLDVIDQATHHTDRRGVTGPAKFTLTDSDKKAIETATVESYAAYRMITSIYNEIGEERFKAANDVLTKITDKIKTGIFEISDVNEYAETIKSQLAGVASEGFKKTVDKLSEKFKESGVTEVADKIKKTDNVTDKSKSKVKEVMEALELDEVAITDGDIFTHEYKVGFISKNKLGKSVGELLKSAATDSLIKSINDNFGKTVVFTNLAATFKAYYGREAKQEEMVLALFYDKDFFSSTLLAGNKDVYKFLSYFVKFGEQLKGLTTLERVQKVGVNTILRNWIESLTEYCCIHPQADPSLFLYAVTDSTKRKALEDRIKRERWGGEVYNKVVYNGLTALTDNETDVLKNRFNSVFSDSIAKRYIENLQSDNIHTRVAAMNALSLKYDGLFNNDYDNKTYLQDTSISNRVFNKFLKSKNLTLKNLLNLNNLTESETSLIADYGEVNEANVLKLRQTQFAHMVNDEYSLIRTDAGNYEITQKGKVVGFSAYRKVQQGVESGDLANTILTGASGRSNLITSLIADDLRNDYFTVDDVVVDPTVLSDDVKNNIISFAKNKGVTITAPTPQFTFLFLRDYFLSTTEGKMSVVVNNNGEYVLGSVESMASTWVDSKKPIRRDSKIEDIFKKTYIPEGVTIKIVDGLNGAQYKPYKSQKDVKTGKIVTTFYNTIEIGPTMFDESQEYLRFALTHELQHAIQFANNLNLGNYYNWLSVIDEKQQKEIIADVRKHVPHLFKGVPVNSAREAQIVNDYGYHGTGESQAYGLEGSDVLDFMPVISSIQNGVAKLTFPWGKTYSLNPVEKSDFISSIWKRTADNLYTFDEWSDVYPDVEIDARIDDWRIRESKTLYHKNALLLDFSAQRQNLNYKTAVNKLIDYMTKYSANHEAFYKWRRLPMNTPGALSEKFKLDLKSKITEDEKFASRKLLQLMIAPDIPYEQFLETDVSFVRMQKRGHLGDSPFVSIYAGATRDSIKFCLEGFYHISSHPEDALDTYIIAGTFKPKDVLAYFGGFESEVLIEPSKLTQSKIYKSKNKIDYHSDPHTFVTFMFDSNKRLILNPEFSLSYTNNIYFHDGLTGEIVEIDELSDYTVYTTDIALDGLDNNLTYLYENLKYENRNDYTIAVATGADGVEIRNAVRYESRGQEYVIGFGEDAIDWYKGKSFDVTPINPQLDISVRFTSSDGRVITAEETSTSLVDLERQFGMSIAPKPNKVRPPHDNELREDDPRAKNFIKNEASTHPTYLARYLVTDDKGNQVLQKDGRPLYHYVYPEDKVKTRKVGQRKWKGTKLEPFTKRYNISQLSKEFQEFVLAAKDLDPALQDKIDGKLKGTLTERDTMSYLRSKDRIDDKTFKAINDAFFKNPYIDTFEELLEIADERQDAWTLWRVAKRIPALREFLPQLEDKELSVQVFRDIVLNFNLEPEVDAKTGKVKKQYTPEELYKRLGAEYVTLTSKSGDKALNVPEHYMRLGLMKRYDGSIKSVRDVASAARVASLSTKWHVTPQDSEWNKVFYDAYSEALEGVEDMDYDSLIEALLSRKAAQLAKETDDYNTVRAELFKYSAEIREMTRNQLVDLFKGDGGLSNAALEGVLTDATGKLVVLDKVNKPTARTYVDRMKGAVRTMARHLDGDQRKAIIKQYPELFESDFTVKRNLYQNELESKTRNTKYVRYKDLSEVQSALEKILDVKDAVLSEHRSIKKELAIERKRNRENARQIKLLERAVKKDGKTPHVVQFVTDDDEVNVLATEKEMPLPLMKLLQVHYNRTAKTAVQNLSKEGDRHKKRVADDFYSNADEILLNLTQKDADDIIDFFVNGVISLNDATVQYQVAELLIMTYFIEIGRTGSVKLKSKKSINNNPNPVNFVISEDQLAKLERLQQSRISRGSTIMSTWRHVLHQLDPIETIQQSIARRAGVAPTNEEIKLLLEAAQTGDGEVVEAAKQKVYKAMRARVIEKRSDTSKLSKSEKIDVWLDKLLQYERLAMLSGPGTWVRNATSNCLVMGSHWTADKMIPKLDEVLYKLFPKNKEVTGQYKMVGTQIDDDVAAYIKVKLVDSKLLDIAVSGINKYDTRKSIKKTDDTTILTEMLSEAAASWASRDTLVNKEGKTGLGKLTRKGVTKVEGFLRTVISDDPWVKQATKKYLGKMITEDIAAGRITKKSFMPDDSISKEFLVYVAEAYKLAAHDYMHRSNPLLAFESKLAAKNYKAYYAYKQIFPFAGAGWNWFMEGLNYTPIGLAKAIINFAKLESTVERMENARQTYKYNEVGPSSKFAEYIVKRNISKGVIGTIASIAGLLLGIFGAARLDEEDEKYKLIIGDVAIDVSDVFGTQGIFIGMALGSGIKNQDRFADVCIAALDQCFMDSTFSDVFNTFRYNDSVGESIAYQLYAWPNMFIPNFLKTLSALAEVHNVQFSAGIHGKIQKLCVNAIPGLSHTLPHYYDPYTGEKQLISKLSFLEKFTDKLTPLGISVYNVSDLERLAISYGINKTQLSGRYLINEESVELKGKTLEKLNMYYGKLNVNDFNELKSDSTKYKIQKTDGTYKTVTWSKMSDKEKAAVVDRIMTNNSSYAKIYVLTDSNNYKYYASESEYRELRKLGITKNVFRASGKTKGFVKIK